MGKSSSEVTTDLKGNVIDASTLHHKTGLPVSVSDPQEHNVDIKQLYDAIIELTKQVGNLAKAQNEVTQALALKKKAGNF